VSSVNAAGAWLEGLFGVGTSQFALLMYSFWSGFGSDLGEFALVGTLAALIRSRNCETHGCWRMGRHQWIDPTTGTAHKLCRKCHPLGHLTAAGVQQAALSLIGEAGPEPWDPSKSLAENLAARPEGAGE
jgi:hypothetical protein